MTGARREPCPRDEARSETHDEAPHENTTPASPEPVRPLAPRTPSALPPAAATVPAVLSAVACQVCGHHALRADELHNGIARGLISRLVCQVCGAHRVMNT